jgi:HEAT repeat protein
MPGRRAGDKLKQLLSTEKEPKLRVEVIRMLGNHGGEEGSTLLLSLYGGESDPGVRKAILSALSSQNNAKALVELARKESDLETKKYIIQRLSRMRSKEANDYLVELLSR